MKLFRRARKDPLWKDEFSINRADEQYVSRRQFTKFLMLTSLGMFAGNVWILVRSWVYREPEYPEQTIGSIKDIPVGGVRLFRYPTEKDPCILIRPDEQTFVAYSQKCTHLSCAVFYAREKNRIECPCHEGYFSVKNGDVLQGPPQRPLPRVKLERRGDSLVAVAMEIHSET
ncbi:MAG TPA: ubiquinol-cytochrome c reductase iron-sulfur subunit [Verrucomicrobiae bacterium]|jgi:Rieske Fe-S protein|nr:ubiquinol-cytochrome c reductase iron-sulfur subunit [Verrucomicrobiae bacterium]